MRGSHTHRPALQESKHRAHTFPLLWAFLELIILRLIWICDCAITARKQLFTFIETSKEQREHLIFQTKYASFYFTDYYWTFLYYLTAKTGMWVREEENLGELELIPGFKSLSLNLASELPSSPEKDYGSSFLTPCKPALTLWGYIQVTTKKKFQFFRCWCEILVWKIDNSSRP